MTAGLRLSIFNKTLPFHINFLELSGSPSVFRHLFCSGSCAHIPLLQPPGGRQATFVVLTFFQIQYDCIKLNMLHFFCIHFIRISLFYVVVLVAQNQCYLSLPWNELPSSLFLIFFANKQGILWFNLVLLLIKVFKACSSH